MTLWTIQTIEQYENLLSKKVIYGDARFMEREFVSAYDWLVTQIEKRIGPGPFPGCYPIWAWYQWEGQKRRKPDLRFSSHLPKGTKGVRIQIEKDENEVLLSDFDLWHYPLSSLGYLGTSELDSQTFDEKLKEQNLYDARFDALPEIFQQKIEKSWELIFDMEFDDPYFTYKKEEKSIQATFWSLSVTEIVRAEKFIAR
jgi:hypothetical protein